MLRIYWKRMFNYFSKDARLAPSQQSPKQVYQSPSDTSSEVKSSSQPAHLTKLPEVPVYLQRVLYTDPIKADNAVRILIEQRGRDHRRRMAAWQQLNSSEHQQSIKEQVVAETHEAISAPWEEE